MQLRLSELYVSTQGEGPRVGELTAFVRFAGCNMRCPGWPCDTQHAIQPSIWRYESELLYPSELADRIMELKVKNVCYTGGEPFMQPNEQLKELTKKLFQAGHSIECFTNGSFEFPVWALTFINFMMDWKLPGSGESQTHREERIANATRLKDTDGIKFVVVDEADLNIAVNVWTRLTKVQNVEAQFWVAPAWDRMKEADLVDWMIKHPYLPWRLNIQVHKWIWPADARGV